MSAMRNYSDKNGHSVSIYTIYGKNTEAGMIEGTPSLVRRHRLLSAEEQMHKNEGLFYWGLEQIEQEIKSSQEWPAETFWEAEVYSSKSLGQVNDKYLTERRSLTIRWYSDDDQPLVFLREIIKSIDFLALSRTRIDEDHDYYEY
jgi:hypothetical protein